MDTSVSGGHVASFSRVDIGAGRNIFLRKFGIHQQNYKLSHPEDHNLMARHFSRKVNLD
jgi:hypothetical protein